MISPPDSFAASFDSIEIDPTRAPSLAAIEAALAMCAPVEPPGFYLVDDADGRFIVDREWGLISLRDEALLEAERGQIHVACLKVIEQSGTSYELALRLRISGRVPQVVGEAEGSPLGEHETTGPLGLQAPSAPLVAWSRYAAARGQRAAASGCGESAPFGAIAAATLEASSVNAFELALVETPPAPSLAAAHWAV